MATPDLTELTDRRKGILEAARRCFVRGGFHRTTMQDVATEAGMSPGNIYRYFQSKEELIAGIVDEQRAMICANISRLGCAEDLVAAFVTGGAAQFHDFPQEDAVLCLQIWAEAARRESFRNLSNGFDREVHARMAAILAEARTRGQVPRDLDLDAVATVISILADGLLVREAVSDDFKMDRDVRHVFAVVEALLRGQVRLPDPAPHRGAENDS